MLMACQHFETAIRKIPISKHKLPNLTPDVSVAGNESEQVGPTMTAERNRSEQQGILQISDELPEYSDLGRDSVRLGIRIVHHFTGDVSRTSTAGESQF